MTNSPAAPSITVSNLTYRFPDESIGLNNVSLDLPPGSRTLLIGANGAGKTTLLRLVSGKRLAPRSSISIGGEDPFTSHQSGIIYLGCEWVLNPTIRSDIPVHTLLSSVGGDHYPERRDELIRILDIDTDWRLHTVSDGERRRVQLAMGLLRPWSVLLLDEVTVDLDVLARSRFLAFLAKETQERGSTVVYATHIMDGLGGWPTHLVRMAMGRVKWQGRVEEFFDAQGEKLKKDQEMVDAPSDAEGARKRKRGDGAALFKNSALLELVLEWLEEDLAERGPRKSRKSEAATYADLEKIE